MSRLRVPSGGFLTCRPETTSGGRPGLPARTLPALSPRELNVCFCANPRPARAGHGQRPGPDRSLSPTWRRVSPVVARGQWVGGSGAGLAAARGRARTQRVGKLRGGCPGDRISRPPRRKTCETQNPATLALRAPESTCAPHALKLNPRPEGRPSRPARGPRGAPCSAEPPAARSPERGDPQNLEPRAPSAPKTRSPEPRGVRSPERGAQSPEPPGAPRSPPQPGPSAHSTGLSMALGSAVAAVPPRAAPGVRSGHKAPGACGCLGRNAVAMATTKLRWPRLPLPAPRGRAPPRVRASRATAGGLRAPTPFPGLSVRFQ